MNATNRTTKIYIKSLPPKLALDLISEYKIPSPWSDVLIETCVNRNTTYKAIKEVARNKKVYLSFWQYGDRLQEALAMFYKAHVHAGKDYSHQIITK